MRMRTLALVLTIGLGCIFTVSSDTIRYTYDDAGRLVRVDYGGGKSINYSYDKSGNLLRRTVTTETEGDAAAEAKRARAKKSKKSGKGRE